MMASSQQLVWMDLEMTGLEPDTCTILEIATIVTDNKLNIIAEGPNLAINQPEAVLAAMDDWNQTHHSDSGLLDRVRDTHITLRDAEELTLEFLHEHVPPTIAPLCGNSIGQDRRFLRKYMPELHDFFHYRSIDVSSIKECVYRWYPIAYHPPRKKCDHLALEDIRGSIEELRFYRERVFVKAG